MTERPVRVVVTDANVLINLMHVERLELLGQIPHHEFVVVDQVREEIKDVLQRLQLDAAISAGRLTLESLTDVAALASFAELTSRIGRGEAACIAIAAEKGWSVGSDERRRFEREVVARLGRERLIGTPEIFVLAIRAGLVTIEQADEDKRRLESHRFTMRFATFKELL